MQFMRCDLPASMRGRSFLLNFSKFCVDILGYLCKY